jgi:hypothetical protein
VTRGKLFGILAGSLAALSVALVGAATAAPATLTGTVGPGFTIDLRAGGKKVTRLNAGVPYRLTVTDRSEDHDFRMTGPGINRVVTGEEFVGKKSVLLRLRAGTYRFFCAPHADHMRGSFRAAR